jgi:hypothetical protein
VLPVADETPQLTRAPYEPHDPDGSGDSAADR